MKLTPKQSSLLKILAIIAIIVLLALIKRDAEPSASPAQGALAIIGVG